MKSLNSPRSTLTKNSTNTTLRKAKTNTEEEVGSGDEDTMNKASNLSGEKWSASTHEGRQSFEVAAERWAHGTVQEEVVEGWKVDAHTSQVEVTGIVISEPKRVSPPSLK